MVSAVRAEHAGGVFFTLADRAGVIQQRAQLAHRNGQVGTEQVFSEIIEKGPADRRLQKGRPPGVARRVPRIFMDPGKAGQGAEHGGQQIFAIAVYRGPDPARDKGGGVLEEPDKIVGASQHVQRNLGRVFAIREQKYRHLGVASAHRVQNHGGGAVAAGVLQVPIQQHGLNERIGHHQHGRVKGTARAQHLHVVLFQLSLEFADQTPGHAFSLALIVHEQDAHPQFVGGMG